MLVSEQNPECFDYPLFGLESFDKMRIGKTMNISLAISKIK